MAAMLLPLRLLVVPQQKKSGGKKKGGELSAPAHIVLNSLKLPKKDSSEIVLLQETLPELCRMHAAIRGATPAPQHPVAPRLSRFSQASFVAR